MRHCLYLTYLLISYSEVIFGIKTEDQSSLVWVDHSHHIITRLHTTICDGTCWCGFLLVYLTFKVYCSQAAYQDTTHCSALWIGFYCKRQNSPSSQMAAVSLSSLSFPMLSLALKLIPHKCQFFFTRRSKGYEYSLYPESSSKDKATRRGFQAAQTQQKTARM